MYYIHVLVQCVDQNFNYAHKQPRVDDTCDISRNSGNKDIMEIYVRFSCKRNMTNSGNNM